MSKVVNGNFTGTGASAEITPYESGGRQTQHQLMTLSISGSWTATIELQRKAVTPQISAASFTIIDSYTSNQEINIEAPSEAFVYRLNCSAHSGGDAVYVLTA